MKPVEVVGELRLDRGDGELSAAKFREDVFDYRARLGERWASVTKILTAWQAMQVLADALIGRCIRCVPSRSDLHPLLAFPVAGVTTQAPDEANGGRSSCAL
jgi:hypothetical protein